MKIAIMHSFMDNIGGAEIVSLVLTRELNADLYTTNIDRQKIIQMGFEDVLGRVKTIGKIPKKAPFKHQLTLFRFRKLKLGDKYDHYIISGDWAMSAGCNNKPNTWYVHSPLNELWQWKDYVRKELLSFWKRPIFDAWVLINRSLTKKYSKSINNWVCNSKNTQNRIKKYYEQSAEIIYPPIYTNHYKNKESKKYWLSVNRLLNHKRVELQIEAFKKMPDKKLIIVGSYEKNTAQFESYKKKIENSLPENVEIKNWVPDSELKSLYSECEGFLTTARDEDFGMTVVEAMSSGKPVVAPLEGGYIESILNNETGILIENIESEKIINAVKKIESNFQDRQNIIINHSKKFDTSVFIEKISKTII